MQLASGRSALRTLSLGRAHARRAAASGVCGFASRASAAGEQPADAAPSITVVTPCTGHRDLGRCLRSVQRQSGLSSAQLRHLVFIDGERPGVDAAWLRAHATTFEVLPVQLPYATGLDGWLGHRQYGAAGFLIDTDYLAYLDEDNWVDEDHCSTFLEAVHRGGGVERVEWGFSLRKVFDKGGRFLADDVVDSLGTIAASFHTRRPFVDTNCMFLRRDVAPQVSRHWYHRRGGADSAVSLELCTNWRGVCTRKFTVNYVAASSEHSNGAQHFTAPPPALDLRSEDWRRAAAEAIAAAEQQRR